MRSDILTRSGQYFDFMYPDAYVLDVKDIAHALSYCCRFAGHCRAFYSVAQHSVYVSQIVPPAHARAALFHDCAEAFLGDVTRPLKRLLPDYKAIEERVERSLFRKLGIAYPLSYHVKAADMQLLHLEQVTLMPKHADPWECDGHAIPDGIVISTITPEAAYSMFMRRADELDA